MKVFPKIKRFSHPNTFGIFSKKGTLSEKYDGACGRLQTMVDGFIIGSKNVEYHTKPAFTAKKKMVWVYLWEYFEERYEQFKHLPMNWIVFGEVIGTKNKHKLMYPFDLEFYVFDVWDELENRFIPYKEWESIVRETGLTVIEHNHMSCSYDVIDSLMKDLDPQRDLYEGFVFKTYRDDLPDGILYGKVYHEKMETIKSEIFGMDKNHVKFKEELKLLDKWITQERFLSVLHQGIDDGREGEGLAMMGWLGREVWRDAVIEELCAYTLAGRYLGKILHLDIKFMSRRAGQMTKRFLDWWLEQQAREHYAV